jgi:protein-S-isoprenylcysteine O-methyltransferase Ste14
VSATAWGSVSGLLANPARLATVVAALALSLVAAASPFNLSVGRRSDLSDLWILPVGLVLTILLAWLPPWLDRRDRWVIDGDGVRWLGVALFVAGGALRLWPIFVLGRRFSGVVAIQEHHELVTDGPYRWIRNPSYLGGLVSLVGWALVFRSVAGLVLVLPFLWILVSRMDAEERLLASEFGAAYDAYRRHTWRLLPGVY